MSTARPPSETSSAPQGHKRRVTVRLGRQGDDRTFDLAFWRAQGPEARLMAAWEMVVEAGREMEGKGWSSTQTSEICSSN